MGKFERGSVVDMRIQEYRPLHYFEGDLAYASVAGGSAGS